MRTHWATQEIEFFRFCFDYTLQKMNPELNPKKQIPSKSLNKLQGFHPRWKSPTVCKRAKNGIDELVILLVHFRPWNAEYLQVIIPFSPARPPLIIF